LTFTRLKLYQTMVHYKPVATAAICCLIIAIGAMRVKRHKVSAANDQINKDEVPYAARGNGSLSFKLAVNKDLNDTPPAPLAAEDEELGGGRVEVFNAKETKPLTVRAELVSTKVAPAPVAAEALRAASIVKYDRRRRAQKELKGAQKRAAKVWHQERHIAETLRFNGIKMQKRADVSRNAKEFSLHDFGPAQQVAVSNLTENLTTQVFQQLENIASGAPYELQVEFLPEGQATEMRPQRWHEVKQPEGVEDQQRAPQHQDEVELWLQHHQKCKCGGIVEGCCRNLACCWQERQMQQEGCCELGGFKL